MKSRRRSMLARRRRRQMPSYNVLLRRWASQIIKDMVVRHEALEEFKKKCRQYPLIVGTSRTGMTQQKLFVSAPPGPLVWSKQQTSWSEA